MWKYFRKKPFKSRKLDFIWLRFGGLVLDLMFEWNLKFFHFITLFRESFPNPMQYSHPNNYL